MIHLKERMCPRILRLEHIDGGASRYFAFDYGGQSRRNSHHL
jgi:hypothetical protein